jgi:hypothetical protein
VLTNFRDDGPRADAGRSAVPLPGLRGFGPEVVPEEFSVQQKPHNPAAFDRSKKGYIVQENRTPKKGSHTLPAATQGVRLPEMALILLPNFQRIYEMNCEGRTEWKSQPAWVVRFRQRTDRPNHLESFAGYPAMLKGRAWTAQDSGELVHLELGQMREIPELQVNDRFLSIDYAPVRFRTRDVQVGCRSLPPPMRILRLGGRSFPHVLSILEKVNASD